MRHSLIAMLLALALLSAPVSAREDESPLLPFVLGDYVCVGKEPDNGAHYSGVARIERQGNQLVLLRRIGPRTLRAEGGVEVPSPPGEGAVLRFRWIDTQPREMTCLVGGDLDNHARLTCYWRIQGRRHVEPGLEAMFPTALWPGTAPNKSFEATAP